MKRIPCLFFVFLLAACAPLPALPTTTQTPTFTPKPTLTSTPAPTATITLTPSLPADFPPKFTAMIGDADYRIDSNNHVWVMAADGQEQDWFELNGEQKYQTTDWKMHQDTPLKIGVEPERNWDYENAGVTMVAFPVVTGEALAEKTMVLNGQEVTVTLLPVQIRDFIDPNKFIKAYLPLIYKDSSGKILLETWVLFESRKNEVISIAEFLNNIQRGQQLEVNLHLGYSRGGCLGDFRCEAVFDLKAAQGFDFVNNKILKDGDILPIKKIKDWFPLGYIYLGLNQ